MDKKFTSLIIGLLCCVWQLSAQQPTFSITPATVDAQLNDVIEFDVEVRNFTNIVTFQYGINWDPAVLEFVEISSINTDANTGFPGLSDPPNGNGTFSKPGGNVPPGQLGVAWFNPSFTGLTRADGTVAFSFRLRAKDCGQSAVRFARPPVPSIEVLDGNFVNVGMDSIPSMVTVTGVDCGPTVPDVRFTIGNGSAQQGNQVCLNFSVADFANIGSVELSISYNSSALQFASVGNFSLSGLQQSNFNTATPGTITLDWSSATGVTLANGTNIFQLCFNTLQAGSSSVSFSNTPLPIDVKDRMGNDVGFTTQNGTVTVTSIPTSTDFKVSVEDKTVNSGDNFCVKVTADNFTDIVGMAYTIRYNPTMLSFSQVTNLNPNIPAFALASHFGAPNTGLSPGFITVNYFNLDLSGVTLPNGAVLFELCFEAIGSGSSQITFTSDITQIEISDSNQEIVPFTSDPGNINITGGPPPPPTDDFRLTIADADIDPGDQFCVEVTADNFTDVVGMAFTIDYDPNNLQFNNITNLNPNIPDFSIAAHFGTPGSGLQPGFITVNYFNNDLTGIDLPNGAVLFELCFTEAGGPGAESDIVFTSDITQIEISDSNQDVIPFTSEEGTVSVSGVFQGFRLTIEDKTVAPNEEFCVEVTAENFTDIVGLAFTMNYDPSQLQFMSVSNLNPNIPDFSVAAHFGTPISGLQPGSITVNYFNNDLTGINLPNNAVLFKLCFRANGLNNTCSDLFFSSAITQIEISDSNQEVVPFNSRRGTICVDDGVPGQVSLTIGNAAVDGGQNFCLPVRVRNFNDVRSMSFTIVYDANEFQFMNAANLNTGLPGFTAANSIGTPGNGTVTVSWNGSAGVSLPNNAVLFELCFRAIGQARADTESRCSELSFSGVPTAISFRNSANEQLLFSGIKGVACINPDFDGFLLTVQDRTVAPDEQFCVPVTVLNFTDVVGVAFTLNYNTAQLQFNQVTNLNTNLADFTVNNNFANPSPGFITMNWFDLSLSPVDLVNGETLFEACFTAIGEDGDVSDITFTSDITPIEVSDSNQDIIPFHGEEGTIRISSILPPTINSPTITHVSCNGGSNGSISLAVSGGTGGPYGINWSGPGGPFNGPTITGLSAGSYSVTVTDVNSTLTSTASYMITQPATGVSISGAATAPSCQGGQDGSITTMVTGGMPSYTYTWSGIPGNIANPGNLSAGTYMLTVADANGCTATRSFNVPNGSGSPISISASVNEVSCFGVGDGSIFLTVFGGQGGLSYFWTPTNAGDGSSATDLAGGNYSVTVYDERGCFSSQSFTVQQPAQALTLAQITGSPIESGDDGSINTSVVGGTSPYVYSWQGPDNYTSASPNLFALDNPGEYCVTVTDANDCTTTGCYDLVVRIQFAEVDIADACGGQNNGSISIEMSGGSGPYTYDWEGYPTSDSILSNIGEGTYFVTVTDINGVQVSGEFDVQQSPEISLNPGYTPVTENTSNTNGAISLSAAGGTGALGYNWSTGATGPSLTGLGEGEYCVTVTDAIGCSKDTCFNMIYRADFLTPLVDAQNTRCADTEDGTLSVNIQGGLFPYEVVITLESGQVIAFETSGQSFTQTDIPPGNGTVEITDALGETQSQDFTIGRPPVLEATVQDFLHDTEEAGCSGMIQLNISGGTGAYAVNWNTGDVGATLNNICGDAAYQPTVRDANGCEVVLDSLELSIFTLDVANVVDTDCPDDPVGAIDIDVSGGEPGYTYIWMNDQGTVVAQQEDVASLPAGVYTVMVSEPSGNTLSEQVTINSTSALALGFQVMSNYNGFAVSCADATDGMASASASGSSGYAYEWTLNNMLVSAAAALSNAAPGQYQLRVTDADGCSITLPVEMSAPEPLTLASNVQDISCHGGKDGSITVFASGGVQGFNYFYQWDNGASSNRIAFLQAGDYKVSVFDANNCQTEVTFTIADPAPITIAFETEPSTDGCNGAAQAVVEGGTEPFRYNWANVDIGIDGDMATNLCPGEYFLQVTDDKGCSSELTSVTVDDRRFPCLDERVVITPDGNGANDEFIIFCVGDYPDNHLEIYNRWGQLVFEADNYDNTWEGTTQDGQALPEGPYYYVLEYTDPEGNRIQQKGSLTILREE